MTNLSIHVMIAFVLLISCGQSFAKDIEISFKFKMSETNASALCGPNKSCKFWDKTLFEMRNPTFPIVPVKVARIVIPLGEKIKSFELATLNEREISYQPEYAGKLYPFSRPGYEVPLDKTYSGGEYPREWIGDSQVLTFRGYSILQIPIYPVRISREGYAVYIQEAKLLVKTVPDDPYRTNELFRGIMRDEQDVMVLADNAGYPGGGDQTTAKGYLVIGPKNIIGDMNTTPLLDMLNEKKSRGLKIEMQTVEAIGADTQKIREYIKERYKKGFIDYVLLVGTHDLLPWKKITSGLDDSSDPVPSDNYYGCLDGDFSEIATYDWACEVAVGRLGVKSKEELASWTKKHMALLKLIKEGKTKEIFNFGESLDSATFGGRVLDFLETGHSDDEKPPATVGFPSYTKFTKSYDTEDHEVSREEFLEAFNAGSFHVLNHLGHANGEYVFRLFPHDITSLPSRPGFYYSQGCYANEPEVDNITIQMVRLPNQGPAAMISNTRYGWYEPGNVSEGTSSILHRTFWHMRFGVGIKNVGFMNAKAKEMIKGVTSESHMIFTMLESSLIGDPELDLGI